MYIQSRRIRGKLEGVFLRHKSVSYLLSHEVQSALQGVGHFDLTITVIDLNPSRAASKGDIRLKKRHF